MMKRVFIDGSAGTTGLRIRERLSCREDIELITLSEELRKDPAARKEALNSCDAAFLCLPDAAAVEAVSMVETNSVTILDTSTAHRTNPAFAYGFPELSAAHLEKVKTSNRIAVPGCHASGFIALVYPLVEAGVLAPDALVSCFSLTGYSGGGKKMIAEYEDKDRNPLLGTPRQYALGQTHKHLKEMCAVTGLNNAPLFSPIVADFYSGMQVSVPLFASQVKATPDEIRAIYKAKYTTPMVEYMDIADRDGFLEAGTLMGQDRMIVTVDGNDDRILLSALYDNLGKGASGAAIECMNLRFGLSATEGLKID
ncbi:MAG: N-acetyl-gamma-glutamyl-phosphate reductase [Clostridia bacterium]|nr:N-acetyl-gamma-glutamyl-phosphate reductase [Clostridia bacterium]